MKISTERLELSSIDFDKILQIPKQCIRDAYPCEKFCLKVAGSTCVAVWGLKFERARLQH